MSGNVWQDNSGQGVQTEADRNEQIVDHMIDSHRIIISSHKKADAYDSSKKQPILFICYVR